MSSTDSPPPTPTINEASQGLRPHLDVGEVVTAVVLGGVEQGGVHVAFTNRGIWLAGRTWRPMNKMSNSDITAVSRVDGGIVIESGLDRLPVRVWDEAAAEKFVAAAATWLDEAH